MRDVGERRLRCAGQLVSAGSVRAGDLVTVFRSAAASWGLRASVLSDNGAMFTGKPRGHGKVALEIEGDGHRSARLAHLMRGRQGSVAETVDSLLRVFKVTLPPVLAGCAAASVARMSRVAW